MKKVKELLLFVALLILSVVLFLGGLGVSDPVHYGRLSPFTLIGLYIRLFFCDAEVARSVLQLIAIPTVIGFLAALVFALILFFVRKKRQISRLLFYIGSGVVGGGAFFVCIEIYDILYYQSAYVAFTIQNLSFSLPLGVFIAFVFWAIELITDAVKTIARKESPS